MKPFTLLAALCAVFTLRAQGISPLANYLVSLYDAGRFGAPFLVITPDARTSALGGMAVAASPDENAQFRNAAQLPFSEKSTQVGFSYVPWERALFPDISLFSGAFAHKLGDRQSIGAGVRYMSYGQITYTSNYGAVLSQARPYELAADVSYGRRLGQTFSAAVTGRFITSDLSDNGVNGTTGHAAAADIGIYQQVPHSVLHTGGELAWGLQVANLGTKISYADSGATYLLPATAKIGGRVSLITTTGNRLSLSADAGTVLLNGRSSAIGFSKNATGGAGLEYSYRDMLSARGGMTYSTDRTLQYATAGAGVHFNVFSVNACYLMPLASRNPLQGTFRFSLSFSFDKFASAPMPRTAE